MTSLSPEVYHDDHGHDNEYQGKHDDYSPQLHWVVYFTEPVSSETADFLSPLPVVSFPLESILVLAPRHAKQVNILMIMFIL